MLKFSYNTLEKLASHIACYVNNDAVAIFVWVPWTVLPRTQPLEEMLNALEPEIKKYQRNTRVLKNFSSRDLNSLPQLEKKINEQRASITDLSVQENQTDLVFIRGIGWDANKLADKDAVVLCVPPLSIDAECEHILGLRDEDGLPSGSEPLMLSDTRLANIGAWLDLITNSLPLSIYENREYCLEGTCKLISPNPGAYLILMKQLLDKKTREQSNWERDLSGMRKDLGI